MNCIDERTKRNALWIKYVFDYDSVLTIPTELIAFIFFHWMKHVNMFYKKYKIFVEQIKMLVLKIKTV